MNHYPHHIGDYLKSTNHLNNEEDLCYRRLIELYYDTEKPIGLDDELTARRIRCDQFMVMKILIEFFTKTKDGWKNKRCESELRQYHLKVKANRINGKLGGRPRKTQSVSETQSVNLVNPTVTQNNLNQNQNQNQNHKPIKEEKRFALPDWVPVEAWEGFCEMRKKSKSAFTERAKALLVAELFKLVESGGNAEAILNQSTQNGWKSVFPIKANGGNGNGKHDVFATNRRLMAEALDAEKLASGAASEVFPSLPAKIHGGIQGR